LKRPDKNVPEEFGRALKRQLLLSLTERLHSEGFEINFLVVGFHEDSFIHASMGWLVGHGVFNGVASESASPYRGRPSANLFAAPVCRRGKPIGIDSAEALIEARISSDEFLKRAFKEFGDILESLVPKPILI
jgi:hypothetical protein